MNFRGFDELRKHVPDLGAVGGRLRMAIRAGIFFGLTTFYFIVSDQIPTWTIDSQIVVTAIGFFLLRFFFSQRKEYIEKYKELAYRNAVLKFVVPGLSVIFASLAHIAYMNGPKWPEGTATMVMAVLGWYWLILGLILWIRAAFTFGLDNLAMLYVYFLQEGRLINSNIYSVLRHPIYAAALRVGLGLALLNTSIYALTFMLFLPLAFTGWTRLVEEKELLERFPDYADYRKSVPAFWASPRSIGAFWKFILTGK